MSRWKRTTTSVLIAVAMLVLVTPSTGTAGGSFAPVTPTGDVQVYNVSLKLVRCTEEGQPCGQQWKDYFKRLVNKPYKPDVLSVLEVPFTKKDEVVAELAASLNTPLDAWNQVHSDKDTLCPTEPESVNIMNCGNSMVVFRVPKFTKLTQTRFPRYEVKDGSCTKGAYPNSRDVAVKLQEKDSSGQAIANRVVVAAAVHLAPDLGFQCVIDSSRDIRSEVESLGGDLTVVTGDFNRTPSGVGWGPNDETEAERRETCPSSWYKQWSLSQPTPDPTCSTGFSGAYRDAIRSKHSTTADEICQEWTMNNQVAESEPGTCKADGKRRIDFIWVRRVVGGVVAEPNIVAAGTDRGYHEIFDWPNRYSDHRALEALIRF